MLAVAHPAGTPSVASQTLFQPVMAGEFAVPEARVQPVGRAISRPMPTCPPAALVTLFTFQSISKVPPAATETVLPAAPLIAVTMVAFGSAWTWHPEALQEPYLVGQAFAYCGMK